MICVSKTFLCLVLKSLQFLSNLSFLPCENGLLTITLMQHLFVHTCKFFIVHLLKYHQLTGVFYSMNVAFKSEGSDNSFSPMRVRNHNCMQYSLTYLSYTSFQTLEKRKWIFFSKWRIITSSTSNDLVLKVCNDMNNGSTLPFDWLLPVFSTFFFCIQCSPSAEGYINTYIYGHIIKAKAGQGLPREIFWCFIGLMNLIKFIRSVCEVLRLTPYSTYNACQCMCVSKPRQSKYVG